MKRSYPEKQISNSLNKCRNRKRKTKSRFSFLNIKKRKDDVEYDILKINK